VTATTPPAASTAITTAAAIPVALRRRSRSATPRSIARSSAPAVAHSTTRIASIAAPCFDALPSSDSTAGKRLAATAAAPAQPSDVTAIASERRSRSSTSRTTTPTASAPSAPRENVR
jgi:hypothetical protein